MDDAPPSATREIILFLLASALPIPWMAVHQFDGAGLAPSLVAVLAGFAILGGAFLLTWAAELAEQDIPQSLTILVLGLVSVLPEYAVDLHFAWTAGKDISYAPFAVANMTGANRLLIGVGWATVVFVACWRSKSSELAVDPRQRLEIRFLLYATLYSFLIPLSGTINLLDAVVLFAIFLWYARTAAGSEPAPVELVGPAAMLERMLGDTGRRLLVLGLLVFAGYGIFIAAEPFAESLVEIGRSTHLDEFLLVQWLAPLASESPEFLIAVLFALRLRGSVGIGALISSKVNQWTLLVGAIPVVFALSAGGLGGLPLDERQTAELVLTSAQSLLAAVLIIDLRFSRREAALLAVLFLGQFLFTSTAVRHVFTVVYLAAALGLLAANGGERLWMLRAIAIPGRSSGRAD